MYYIQIVEVDITERAKTCCFTGHRPTKLPWGENENDDRCRQFKMRLSRVIEEVYMRGYHHFICGMARGCDLYFIEAVLLLREQYPHITVEAARPCESQANSWPQAEKHRYNQILDRCNYETLVQLNYDRGCMMRRNRYMVERSSLLIAAYDGIPKGGTASTVAYALRKKLELVMVTLEEASHVF